MIFRTKKYKNLVLVLEPKNYKEVDGRRMINPGLRVEFQNGKYETENKTIIKILKGHDDYGIKFFAEELGELTPNPVGAAKEEQRKLEAEIAADTDHKEPVKAK